MGKQEEFCKVDIDMDAAAAAMPTFRHPFTMCISGCTGSGKSQWVLRFLQHLQRLVVPDGSPRAVFYCYGELNENILRLQQLEARQKWNGKKNDGDYDDDGKSETSDRKIGNPSWTLYVHNGVPEETQIRQLARQHDGHLLLVLDDLMIGLRASLLDVLFTRGSHNWGCSVLLVTQHLFASKELRIARNNAHYLVLMRNPAGALQVRNLATQIFPGAKAHRFFMEAYEDATSEPFGYLLIDMHPCTSNAFRLKTHIYPDDEACVVYMPIEGSVSNKA